MTQIGLAVLRLVEFGHGQKGDGDRLPVLPLFNAHDGLARPGMVPDARLGRQDQRQDKNGENQRCENLSAGIHQKTPSASSETSVVEVPLSGATAPAGAASAAGGSSDKSLALTSMPASTDAASRAKFGFHA